MKARGRHTHIYTHKHTHIRVHVHTERMYVLHHCKRMMRYIISKKIQKVIFQSIKKILDYKTTSIFFGIARKTFQNVSVEAYGWNSSPILSHKRLFDDCTPDQKVHAEGKFNDATSISCMVFLRMSPLSQHFSDCFQGNNSSSLWVCSYPLGIRHELSTGDCDRYRKCL